MIAFKKGFTISTKLFNSKLPLIQLVNFIQPVGLGWANYDTNQLILTPKYHFANNQKPHSQHPGKQQPTQQTQQNKSTPASVPPPAHQSSSKSLYTLRDMFVLMMSSVGVFLWGQILLKQYYKNDLPVPQQPIIIEKVVEKQQAKQEQQQPLGLVFLLFLMCVFIIAAEFWRMRNFDKIYQELRNVNRVLKDEVHGIQLQLIRERLGGQ